MRSSGTVNLLTVLVVLISSGVIIGVWLNVRNDIAAWILSGWVILGSAALTYRLGRWSQ